MFRRKEEGATDSTTPVLPSAASAAANGAAHAHESATPVSAAAASHAPAHPTHSSHTPTAAAARTVADSARLASSSPLGNYRPSPIAEFNRNNAARSSEPARSAVSAASSFTGNAERNASASTKPVRRVLTVGNDILLKGEIATCDRLVIEGRVEAKLSDVHTVEIAECGSFKGTAEVEDAEISGIFEGDLVVRNRLVIYTSGEVRGNISYGEIEIERGGKLTGQIKTVATGAQAGAKAKPVDASDANKARSLKENVAA